MTTTEKQPADDQQTPSPAVTEPKSGDYLPDWVLEHAGWTRALERVALLLERPINRFSGTTQLNPFYHTGTIAFFLLLVVGATGFYLFIFFQYGFDLSYNSILRYDSQFIARFIRALHRYASGALVITTLLHAYRILFMERFRGPRWLAWTTGVAMTIILWAAGVTGYWLIWDERAQLITYGVRDMLGPWGASFMVLLARAWRTGESWFILFGILVVHVLLFVATAVFFWLHIRRLNRAKWIPEFPWIAGMGVVLVLGSLLFPVRTLPQADFTRLPTEITFDPIFLFYLPTIGNNTAAFLLWGSLFLILLFFSLLPWIPGLQKNKPPKVNVIEEKCTGCTRCAIDCPYKALEMIELPEGSAHKFLAVANPDMCVSCGICIGSCLDDAITLGDTPPRAMWTMVQERIAHAQKRAVRPDDIEVVFACERYVNQGARPFLNRQLDDSTITATHENVEVIAVPCSGSIPSDLLTYALEEGAAEVRVLGCPPNDCAHRLGNLWSEQRLTRERPPRLRRKYANVPISAVWLPPDEFKQGLAADINAEETNWLETRRILGVMTWKNFVPAFTMLAVVMLIQIVFSDIMFPAAFATSPDKAQVQIILSDMGLPLSGALNTASDELTLRVEIDGDLLGEFPIESATAVRGQPFFAEYPIAGGGEHDIHVYYYDAVNGATYDVARRRVLLDEGAIYHVDFDISSGRCINDNCTQ
jgi:NAD-dependent dihydropyrimidine dehydrogenase PreA subunit